MSSLLPYPPALRLWVHQQWIEDCPFQQNYVHGDPDIHLLSDPTIITHEAVNAFQRYSSVILQRSLREGFGFTDTEG